MDHIPSHEQHSNVMSRRRLLRDVGLGGLALFASPASARDLIQLTLNGRPTERAMTSSFPQKGKTVLQCSRPPLLETP